ncbi:MAG TPA: c-type cytochrome [Kofleriaceae bacterium]
MSAKLAVLVLVLTVCHEARAAPPAAKPPEARGLAGKDLYMALCAPCHAANATGYAADRAPSLVSTTFLESASDDFLEQSISAGRSGTSMAAYGKGFGGPLDPEAVRGLVKYLRTLGPAARPLPAIAPGVAADGATVYAQRCFSCHGDLKTRGEAPSLMNPQLLGASTSSFLRYAIARGRPGTRMVAFADQLTDADLDNVVAYLRTFAPGGPAAQAAEARLPAPTGKEPLVMNPRGKPPAFKLTGEPCQAMARPDAGPCTPAVQFVSVAQVAGAVVARQRLVIIDARPPSEWMRVHIAGAVSIPYHELARLDELPRDGTWVIAYCACPHHLSGIVIAELLKRGYKHVAVLDEGINEWHRRKLPVVAAPGVQPPPSEPVAR